MDRPLWTPSSERIERANITRFIRFANADRTIGASDYEALYAWSIAQPAEFWTTMWDFGGIRSAARGPRVALDPHRMRPGAHFFPDARLNFTENVLRKT